MGPALVSAPARHHRHQKDAGEETSNEETLQGLVHVEGVENHREAGGEKQSDGTGYGYQPDRRSVGIAGSGKDGQKESSHGEDGHARSSCQRGEKREYEGSDHRQSSRHPSKESREQSHQATAGTSLGQDIAAQRKQWNGG